MPGLLQSYPLVTAQNPRHMGGMVLPLPTLSLDHEDQDDFD